MVYWISENHDKSLKILSNLASEIDSQLTSVVFSAAFNSSVKNAWENFKKEVTIRNSFDPNYTADQFTPVLNYALAAGLQEKKEILYFDKKNAAVQIQDEKAVLIRIRGKSVRVNRKLTIGYNISQAEAALGKSSASSKTHLIYKGKQKLRLNIQKGAVKEILLY